LIVAPRREHSRKPDEVYGRVEQLCAGPYLELFARQQWPGWHSWGDQVDRFEPAIEAFDPINKIWDSVAQEFRAIRQRKAAAS
jgi:N6-adenosine-specific RNA methylase IME4